MLTNKTLKHIIDGLDSVEKDDVYRYLWSEYVREDVKAVMADREDADENEVKLLRIIDYVVEHYVYEGNYDCNLSYWENIDNLITQAIEDCRADYD